DLPDEGAVAVIASKLRASVEKLGLVAYGEKGEPFDPTVHEAIAQLPNPEVDGETVADVVQRGYRVGERIVRVAKVAVFVAGS
ncbi:MAG: nucleotide exchange factor GrpE, partial [Pseudoclavibacter sp.]